jgi:hypothetical protein
MAISKASRQTINPRVREEVATQTALIAALTFSATVTAAEAQALRDAVVTALQTVFGQVT